MTSIQMLSVTLLLCALLTTALSGQERKVGAGPMEAPSPEKMMEGMKKWQASMRPGKQHEVLRQLSGKWKTTIRMFMGGVGAPPMTTQGECEAELIMGDRFLMEQWEADFMMPNEKGEMVRQPLKGMMILGYDNFRHMYVATVAGTMGTNLIQLSGSFDSEGRHLNLYGELDEPMLDVVGRMARYQIRFVSENEWVMEVYDLHVSTDYKVMEIQYQRQN